MLPDFKITSSQQISKQFISRNILNYSKAAEFILNLPYGRNTNKNDLLTVFTDGCATCGTKHALLKTLADENSFPGIQLILGLVKMNAKNTPEVGLTLEKNKLDYIPEAHNYLKYKGAILDHTKPNFQSTKDPENILEEIEIQPSQISDFKVVYHKNYLQNWLNSNPQIKLSLNELWVIREQCIKDLADPHLY